MKVFCSSPKTGKTIRCVEESIQSGARMVCLDSNECDRAIGIAEDMLLPTDFPPPMTFQEFLNRINMPPPNDLKSASPKGYIIDDTDIFLTIMSNGSIIKMVSMNGTNINKRNV